MLFDTFTTDLVNTCEAFCKSVLLFCVNVDSIFITLLTLSSEKSDSCGFIPIFCAVSLEETRPSNSLFKKKKVRRTFFPPNRPTSHLWRGDLEPWVQGTPRHKRKRVKPESLTLFLLCGRWDLNPHVVTHT